MNQPLVPLCGVAALSALGLIGCMTPPPLPTTTTEHPIPGSARMSVAWASAGDDVNLDLNWKLPSGAWLQDVVRTGWAVNGVESIELATSIVPDGVHELWLAFHGSGASALTTLGIDLFDLHFALNQPLLGALERKIVVETRGGDSWTLFNGWLPATHPDSGGVSGLHPLEVQAAWRDAFDAVNVDLRVVLPSGVALDTRDDGWAEQGFERAILAPGAALPEGTYQLNFQLNGSGQAASVTQIAAFPGWSRRWEEVLLGPECRIVGLDVTSGQARLLYDGWKDAGDADAGGLSEQHAAEFVVGWRDASGEVDVDIELISPNGTRVPSWHNGWLHQGFERVWIHDRAAIPSGQWRVRMNMSGGGRTATVSLQGRFLGWRFATTQVMLGDTQREIILSVNHEAVVETANNFR